MAGVRPRPRPEPLPLTPRRAGIRYRTPEGEWMEHTAIGRRGVGVPAPAPERPIFEFGETPEERSARLARIAEWQAELEAARLRDIERRRAREAARHGVRAVPPPPVRERVAIRPRAAARRKLPPPGLEPRP